MLSVMKASVDMSGDSTTLSWKPNEQQRGSGCSEANAETVKILKVCFISNSFNIGKNFKLVKCDSSWKIKVSFREILNYSLFICK